MLFVRLLALTRYISVGDVERDVTAEVTRRSEWREFAARLWGLSICHSSFTHLTTAKPRYFVLTQQSVLVWQAIYVDQ